MAALPDLDDLLDQIEGSVTSGAQPIATGRRGFFDPVPCISTSRAPATGAPPQTDRHGAGSSGNPADIEEKLSFIEFLKVTAKEAEELHQLQRLHDDQQEARGSKRVSSERREITAAAGTPRSASVPSAAPAKWTPPALVVPEMPELPDVPEGVLPELLYNGRAAAAPSSRRAVLVAEEEFALASKEHRARHEFEETGRENGHSLSPPHHLMPRLETASPELGVEMGEEAELEQRIVQPPTPSPEPCLVAVEEHPQLLIHQQQREEVECAAEAVEEAEEEEEEEEEKENGADDEFDEVLAYLAKCEGSSAAAAAAPSPIAVTPPTCNTAASFDVVSFQALPTEAMGESEMERELEELAQDFADDSDQPELVRDEQEQHNGTADDTFYSAVESLDRSADEEEENGKEEDEDEAEEIKDQVEEEEEAEDDDDDGKEEEEAEAEEESTLAEERQEVDLVFVNDSPASGERVAEVEAANSEDAEVSIVIIPPESTVVGVEDVEETMEVEEKGEQKQQEERETAAPMVSPSISGSSAASIEVLERVEVEEMMEQEMRQQDNKLDEAEEPVVVEEEEADPIEDTVAQEQESIDIEAEDAVGAAKDTVDEVAHLDDQEAILEEVPEFAAVEEAADSMVEEEEGMLRERGEGETAPPPSYEVVVEDRPQQQEEEDAATAVAASRAARFRDRVISDVHEIDGDEEPARTSRLTESELQLGKTPPIWIPDAECAVCMLCSARFTFLLRRHHCRACGRVLCAGCCGERMVLAYQPDKGKARVCSPCASTLQRVEEWEKEREGSPESSGSNGGGNEAADATDADAAAAAQEGGVLQGQQLQPDFGTGASRKKSILKVRAASVVEEAGGVAPAIGGSAAALAIPSGQRGDEAGGSMVAGSAPRGVVFRDGIKPGEHAPDDIARAEEERREGARAQPQLRKKSRKRAAVSRRVAALKVEEQLASALPTHARPDLLLVQGRERAWTSQREAECALATGNIVHIAVNRLLTVAVQMCPSPLHPDRQVMCAVSQGFHALGLDEIVFCWDQDPAAVSEDSSDEAFEAAAEGEEAPKRLRAHLPAAVLRRMEEILQACFSSSDLADVRRVAARMPRLLTSMAADCDEEPPMTRHTMFVPLSHQSAQHLPLSPLASYVFAVPIRQSELLWALASPNRVLLRLGLASGCYPTPIVIKPDRETVYSEETSNSVLKMFNDIGTWSYRMQHVVGGTVTLSNEETTIRLPQYAQQQMRKIVENNRNMLAWLCDVNTEADSHLICIETEEGNGPYGSNIFQKATGRSKTGATFVIFDGALKTPADRVQVSVCEDGIVVRLPSEGLVELINALLDGKDYSIESGAAHRLHVVWTEVDEQPAGTRLLSPIDGRYLGNKMQYGLTLERVISSTIPSAALAETATRLSHVFNMRDNLIAPEDEAKVFSVAELVASEAAGMVDEYLPLLAAMGVNTLALRVTVERERIEYEVAEWAGLETEQARFRESLDKLLPVFVNVLGYIPHGFSIEMWLSVVSTTPLPIEI